MSKGEHGAHWEGCEEAHHDCCLIRLRKAEGEIEELKERLSDKVSFEYGFQCGALEQKVAELEAEVKRLLEFGKEFIWGEERPTEWRTLFVRAKEAEAALAERDTRRCEMCGHWGKHEMWPDQGWCSQHNEMDADCSCSEWTARAEEGSGDE